MIHHWLCCTRCSTQETSISQEKPFIGPCVRFCAQTMQSVNFLVVLNFCLLPVARPSVSLLLQQGMGVPLLREWAEGWCSKESLVVFVAVVRAVVAKPEGRAILGRRRKQREFNPTKGYTDEDVTHNSLFARATPRLLHWSKFSIFFLFFLFSTCCNCRAPPNTNYHTSSTPINNYGADQ